MCVHPQLEPGAGRPDAEVAVFTTQRGADVGDLRVADPGLQHLALRAVNPSQVRYMKRFEGQIVAPVQHNGDTRVADTAADSASGGIQ